MEDMKSRAEEQPPSLLEAEVNLKQSFRILKQSLDNNDKGDETTAKTLSLGTRTVADVVLL